MNPIEQVPNPNRAGDGNPLESPSAVAAAVRLSECATRILAGEEALNFRFPEGYGLPAGQFELRLTEARSYEITNEELGLQASFSSSGIITATRFSGPPNELPSLLEKALNTLESWTAGAT